MAPASQPLVFWLSTSRATQRIVLENQLKPIVESQPRFCQKCLADLKTARKEARLSAGQANPEALARKAAAAWAEIDSPQGLLDAEWKRILCVSEELQKAGFQNLAELLKKGPALARQSWQAL